MKVIAENPPAPAAAPAWPTTLHFPKGIVGFPKHKQGQLVEIVEQRPFRWLSLEGPTAVHFVVIEPSAFMADYAPELFDEDAADLEIESADDALVLNIVTVAPTQPATATANLVGPVVINRHTGRARQVVIHNHADYTARHPLVTAS